MFLRGHYFILFSIQFISGDIFNNLFAPQFLGGIKCMRCRLFLLMLCLSVCHAADIGGSTCSVRHVPCASAHAVCTGSFCSLCQITLTTCFALKLLCLSCTGNILCKQLCQGLHGSSTKCEDPVQ